MNPNLEHQAKTGNSSPKKKNKAKKNRSQPSKSFPIVVIPPKKTERVQHITLDEHYIKPVPSDVVYGLLPLNAYLNFDNYLTPGVTMPRPPAPTPQPDDLDITLDLQDLLQDIIAFLIDDAAVVHITHAKSVNKIIFSVMVPPNEMGKIIGKKGAIIKSLLTMFKAMGNKYEKLVEIELVEPRIKAPKVEE